MVMGDLPMASLGGERFGPIGRALAPDPPGCLARPRA